MEPELIAIVGSAAAAATTLAIRVNSWLDRRLAHGHRQGEDGGRGALETRVAVLETRQAEYHSAVEQLRELMQEMKRDVGAIQQDVAVLKERTVR